MRTCVFCGRSGGLTKEHLYPECLQARRSGKRVYSTAAAPESFVGPSALQIGDVCARCNNETLSQLDNYFCKLFDSQIRDRVIREGDVISFQYDYSKLTRWLLKVLYNNSRAAGAEKKYADHLRSYASFMMGHASIPNELMLLLRLTTAIQHEAKEIVSSHMAAGLIRLPDFDKRLGETYLVSIDSFSFIVVLLVNSAGRLKRKALDSLESSSSLGEATRLKRGCDNQRISASEFSTLDIDGQLILSDIGKWKRLEEHD